MGSDNDHKRGVVDTTHKFIVVYMLEQPAVGKRFTKWPLHLTLMPWFRCDEGVERVVERLGNLANNTQSFSIVTGEKAIYGPKHDVPVRLVEKTAELERFHARICFLLTKSRCDFENEEYSRESYSPHITIRGDRYISKDIRVLVDSIDIVENLDDGKMGRKVIKRFNFSALNQ